VTSSPIDLRHVDFESWYSLYQIVRSNWNDQRLRFADRCKVIHILEYCRYLAALTRMHDHVTVQAVSCDINNFVGWSKSTEKLWSHDNTSSATVDKCSYTLQLSMLISYLDFRHNAQ